MTRAVRFLILFAAILGLAACAQMGQNNEFTAHNGAWHTYKKNCSGCHGFYGQGIPPVGGELVGNPWVTGSRAEAVRQVIRNGRRGKDKVKGEYGVDPGGLMSMPGFPQPVISDRELDVLVEYLRGPFQQGRFNN